MRIFAFGVVAAIVAFGANVRAEPEKHASNDSLLVSYELKDGSDVVRALHEFYTKYEFFIPMRDGKKLYADAFVPKDRSRTYPIMMMRTPYGIPPYGVDNDPVSDNDRMLRRFAPSYATIREGYAFVHADVRGRMMSEGDFVDVRPHATGTGPTAIDESTDTFDTIEFLLKNVPNNNGNVGAWGISYPGFYAAEAAASLHPALKAVSPQAPVTEWFLGDDFHHNGAFFEADAFLFHSSFGHARDKLTTKWPWAEHEMTDVYDFFLALGPLQNANEKYLHHTIKFWDEMQEHGSRDDFWKARDPRPSYKNARAAIMTVGGLFDAEDLFGALATYRAFETQSPGAKNTLVLGPWRHGGWARTDGDSLGDISFGAKTSLFYREKIESPFFAKYLKGKDVPAPPEAYVFETGTNEWRRYDAWPPKDAKPTFLAFRAHGKVSSAAYSHQDEGDGFDSFVSDPHRPVPYRAHAGTNIEAEYILDDQRFAAERPDVLVYRSGVLTSDVTIAGPITASLYVSTTGTDADFVVKVIDVFPGDAKDPDPNPRGVRMAGYEEMIRGEIMRGKFRRSFEHPEAFTPGEPTEVTFTLPDVCHTFRSGHELMVQIQSSWFPLADRNPQTFVDIYGAKEADFKPQTHRVYHTHEHASGISVLLQHGKI